MPYGRSSICAICKNQPSITSCEGCQQKYCSACLSQHRNELSVELDELFNRRNELFEIITNSSSSNNTTNRSPCLEEINRWQNEMHTNIDRIASTARDHVRQFLSESSKNVRIELDRVSQDLQQRQKTNGYVEGDLDRIKQQLTKLNDIVQRFNEQIRIDTSNTKNIQWNSLLVVVPTNANRTTTKATYVPTNSTLYSSSNQQSNSSMPVSHQQFNSNKSSSKFGPYSNNYHSSTKQNRSSSMNSQPRTYICIGCKTQNNYNENGRNNCSVCRFPYTF
ncbi:unnamed protein product [Rotaria sordida]|uniref:B box-type domain-containing protein n=1 Tax=Rotaria sordida TaxID=392033 RepID=A0A813UN79_9BILA|nr:unnamed protein product [Rotaria sordida]CAF3684734.1 unnamed protein product [Rotaria sordida]